MVGHFIQWPVLSIAFQGSSVLLSWPTNFGWEFTLQSTVNPGAAGWTTYNLQAPPAVINGQYVVTISNAMTNTQQYYRLKGQ